MVVWLVAATTCYLPTDFEWDGWFTIILHCMMFTMILHYDIHYHIHLFIMIFTMTFIMFHSYFWMVQSTNPLWLWSPGSPAVQAPGAAPRPRWGDISDSSDEATWSERCAEADCCATAAPPVTIQRGRRWEKILRYTEILILILESWERRMGRYWAANDLRRRRMGRKEPLAAQWNGHQNLWML